MKKRYLLIAVPLIMAACSNTSTSISTSSIKTSTTSEELTSTTQVIISSNIESTSTSNKEEEIETTVKVDLRTKKVYKSASVMDDLGRGLLNEAFNEGMPSFLREYEASTVLYQQINETSSALSIGSNNNKGFINFTTALSFKKVELTLQGYFNTYVDYLNVTHYIYDDSTLYVNDHKVDFPTYIEGEKPKEFKVGIDLKQTTNLELKNMEKKQRCYVKDITFYLV